jgi:putative ABC transport system permease protein
MAAVPFGLVMGYWLVALMVWVSDTEMFRIPLVVGSNTYAMAAVTIVVATVVSALIVRHRIDHLDLVEVLKTRE